MEKKLEEKDFINDNNKLNLGIYFKFMFLKDYTLFIFDLIIIKNKIYFLIYGNLKPTYAKIEFHKIIPNIDL